MARPPRFTAEMILDAASSAGFLESIVAKTSYVLVWGDPDTNEPVVTWEKPDQVIVEVEIGAGMGDRGDVDEASGPGHDLGEQGESEAHR